MDDDLILSVYDGMDGRLRGGFSYYEGDPRGAVDTTYVVLDPKLEDLRDLSNPLLPRLLWCAERSWVLHVGIVFVQKTLDNADVLLIESFAPFVYELDLGGIRARH